MLLTVNCNLNARTGAPKLSAPCTYFHIPGDKLEITDVVVGDEIEGNSIWYKATGDDYFWSGGFAEIDFALPNVDFKTFDFNRQIKAGASILNRMIPEFQSKVQDFRGASISLKNKGGKWLDYHSITIYVAQKSNNADYQIPKALNCLGLQVETDVVESNLPTPSLIGQLINQKTYPNVLGSAGLVYTVGSNQYLLTNFHVVCNDFLKSFSLSQSIKESTPVFNRTVMLNGTTLGTTQYAQLNSTTDLAVISLPASANNILPDPGKTDLGVITPDNYPDHTSSILADHSNYNNIDIYAYDFNAKDIYPAGRITGWNSVIPVHYFGIGNTPLQMQNVIVTTRISVKGDSGNVVFDDSNKILGILIADNNPIGGTNGTASYVLPIDTVFSLLQTYDL